MHYADPVMAFRLSAQAQLTIFPRNRNSLLSGTPCTGVYLSPKVSTSAERFSAASGRSEQFTHAPITRECP